MMSADEGDDQVLACLREHGPGTVTVKQLAAMTGLGRVTVRTSVLALGTEGLVCAFADRGETQFVIRHLHAEPGLCGEPLSCVIQEVHPDG